MIACGLRFLTVPLVTSRDLTFLLWSGLEVEEVAEEATAPFFFFEDDGAGTGFLPEDLLPVLVLVLLVLAGILGLVLVKLFCEDLLALLCRLLLLPLI
jgi:hypothetical protein